MTEAILEAAMSRLEAHLKSSVSFRMFGKRMRSIVRTHPNNAPQAYADFSIWFKATTARHKHSDKALEEILAIFFDCSTKSVRWNLDTTKGDRHKYKEHLKWQDNLRSTVRWGSTHAYQDVIDWIQRNKGEIS